MNKLTKTLAALGLVGTLAGCASKEVKPVMFSNQSIEERTTEKANSLAQELGKYGVIVNPFLGGFISEIEAEGYNVTFCNTGWLKIKKLSIKTPDKLSFIDYSGNSKGVECKFGVQDTKADVIPNLCDYENNLDTLLEILRNPDRASRIRAPTKEAIDELQALKGP